MKKRIQRQQLREPSPQPDQHQQRLLLKHLLKETPVDRSLRVIREFMLDSSAVGDGFDLSDSVFVDYVVEEK